MLCGQICIDAPHVCSQYAAWFLSDSCVWSRFVSVSDYPSYDQLLWEWDTGIVCSDKMERTVPLSQLEQDKAEGKQVEGSGYEVCRSVNRYTTGSSPSTVCWVLVIKEKMWLQKYHCTAQDVMTDRQGRRGPKPCDMTSLLKALIEPFEKQWGSPVEFEKGVLKWKLTASAVAQAAGKRKGNKK